MKNKSKEAVLEFLMQNVIGKKVLKVNAGGTTGSVFCLELGDSLRIKQERAREFTEGDFSIMVYSSWRLDDLEKSKPITSWQEDSGLQGKMTLALKDLLNDVVESVSVSSFYDLDIRFKSRRRLAAFCDLTSNQEMDTNWFFRDHEKYYTVNNAFDIVNE
jgi:hypothetical protein